MANNRYHNNNRGLGRPFGNFVSIIGCISLLLTSFTVSSLHFVSIFSCEVGPTLYKCHTMLGMIRLGPYDPNPHPTQLNHCGLQSLADCLSFSNNFITF